MNYKITGKRAIDIFLSLLGLIALSPIFVTLFFLLKINTKNGVFFSQIRPGKNGELFRLYKFKTMRDEFDTNNNLLPDHQRISSFGAFLRSTSLDEIPQLWNVLIGDMSLVGPRPLLPEYLPLYSAEQQKRHDVKPGITGWAQINGRNAVSWQKKFELDVWYVQHLSFGLDLKILFVTAQKVLMREKVNAAENLTMPKFEGN